MMAKVEVVAHRNQRKAGSVDLVVPTTVRVEAGWDRTSPGAAIINRLRARDAALGTLEADRATRLRSVLGISVTDAHVGAVAEVATEPVAIVTSDRHDTRRILGQLARNILIVAV
jgi:hypothetical protein